MRAFRLASLSTLPSASFSLALALAAGCGGAVSPGGVTPPVAEPAPSGDPTAGSGVIYGAGEPPKAAEKPAAPPSLVGLAQAGSITPERGFVDDPWSFDSAGGHVLWINTDAATFAELREVDLGQGLAQIATIDLAAAGGFQTTARKLELAEGGLYFLVVQDRDDQPLRAVFLDGNGKLVRKLGPAGDIRLGSHEGAPVVALFDKKPLATKRGQAQTPQLTQYDIELVAVDSGKRIGKKATLVADASGLVAKLDFRINHFADDYSRIVGTVGGVWDRKEDQRSPDQEGWYDVTSGTFSRKLPIEDLVAHKKHFALWAAHWNEPSFLQLAGDLSSLLLVTADKATPVELAEPVQHYAPTSLEYQRDPGGSLFFTLRIDPVNADAVAHKKADPAYLDIYELPAGATKAVRRGRLLADKRVYRWHATPEIFAVVEKPVGFGRGGKQIDVYRFSQIRE